MPTQYGLLSLQPCILNPRKGRIIAVKILIFCDYRTFNKFKVQHTFDFNTIEYRRHSSLLSNFSIKFPLGKSKNLHKSSSIQNNSVTLSSVIIAIIVNLLVSEWNAIYTSRYLFGYYFSYECGTYSFVLDLCFAYNRPMDESFQYVSKMPTFTVMAQIDFNV